MNNNRENSVMKLSNSWHTSSASQPPLQMHNFMPMPSSSIHLDHGQSEAERGASLMNQLKHNMQSFWRERLSEICDAPTDVRTPHTLPLARIKKVMKSDERVKEDDESIATHNNNNHDGVYVPHPLPANYLQELGGDDHHLAFPMNLPHNFNPAYLQNVNPSFPPPDDGANPYLSFKEFFQ